MQKRENEIRPYGFCDRLVVKLIGKTEWIQRFISDIQKLYPADRITLSPILRNKDTDGFHCFVNILMEAPKT